MIFLALDSLFNGGCPWTLILLRLPPSSCFVPGRANQCQLTKNSTWPIRGIPWQEPDIFLLAGTIDEDTMETLCSLLAIFLIPLLAFEVAKSMWQWWFPSLKVLILCIRINLSKDRYLVENYIYHRMKHHVVI